MNDLGLVYLRSAREEEAVRQWLGLLDRHPGYFLAYYNLGLAYERLGQRQNARQAVKKFLELTQDEVDKKEAQRWLKRLEN
jgi:tetratricopeptide (TPR) repeat protein